MVRLFSFLISLSIIFPAAAQRPAANTLRKQAQQALQSKDFVKAAPLLYQMARQTKKTEDLLEAKYFLGISLAKLGMTQIASFALMDVARRGKGKYQKMALASSVRNATTDSGRID
jgi:hypothetical protein